MPRRLVCAERKWMDMSRRRHERARRWVGTFLLRGGTLSKEFCLTRCSKAGRNQGATCTRLNTSLASCTLLRDISLSWGRHSHAWVSERILSFHAVHNSTHAYCEQNGATCPDQRQQNNRISSRQDECGVLCGVYFCVIFLDFIDHHSCDWNKTRRVVKREAHRSFSTQC